MTLQEARGRLRKRGLRATRPRVAVFSLLWEIGGHHSVDGIGSLLASRGLPFPRMTIYNVVSDLTVAGLLMCADTGPGKAVYEASETWHHHFVCLRCGIVMDIPCALGTKPCMEPPETFRGTVEEAQVIFRGTCEACSAPAGVLGSQGFSDSPDFSANGK